MALLLNREGLENGVEILHAVRGVVGDPEVLPRVHGARDNGIQSLWLELRHPGVAAKMGHSITAPLSHIRRGSIGNCLTLERRRPR